jgi:hypothetical protein
VLKTLKQLLQWLKREPIVQYIPILGNNIPYAKSWENVEYLKSVESMGINNVWITEIIEVITKIRNEADNTESVEMLKAYNKCLKITKDLLIKPEQAKAVKNALREYDGYSTISSSLK